MPNDRPIASPWRTPLLGTGAFVGVVLVLTWGALPYLSGQIDDSFIVFAYAHRIAELGEIAWNTGDRVEGYSSPLHLLLMVAGCLGGADLSVFARIASFVASATTLFLLLRPRFGPDRLWLAGFVAAWQPFQHWALAGLETAMATTLAVAGWSLAFGTRRSWAVGTLLLIGFSLTRPEGVAWLVAALLLRLRHERSLASPEVAVLGGLGFLGAYHATRVAYFGALLPTPWLVKIVAVGAFGSGLREAGLEVLSAVPLLALAVALRRDIRPWVWFPAALQAALLIRAGGDWMGHARFLLPGVVASVAAAFATGTPRPTARYTPFLLLPLAMLSFAWEPAQMQGVGPRWRDPWFLRSPLSALRAPWSVPLLDEVAFLVRRIPPGAGAELSDVGLPGNLDDVRIWDGAGLTDRVVAEIIAGQGGMSAALKERFDDPDAIWCLRYGITEEGGDPADGWMKAMFPEVATQPDARGLFWRCRPGGEPSGAVARDRWRRLLDRFPIQDGIRRHYARALLADGQLDEAVAVASAATWVRSDADGWLVFEPIASENYAPGRGWPLYGNGALSTVALPPSFWATHAVALDADDPGADGARAAMHWEPACGEAVSVSVSGPTVAAVPRCDAGDARRLVVEFLNDEWRPDFDRNLFVTLTPTAATPEP